MLLAEAIHDDPFQWIVVPVLRMDVLGAALPPGDGVRNKVSVL
jgi:hypothetical protein